MQRDKTISDIANVAKDMRESPAKNQKWESTQARVMREINKLGDKRLTPEEFRVVKLERKAAQLPIRIAAHRSNLNETLADVTNNMKLLKESKNRIATEMHKNYEQAVKDVQPLATTILESRTELAQEVSAFTAEKDERIDEIKAAMKQGKPLSMIKGMIDQAEKKADGIYNEFNEINKKEDQVKYTLQTLKRETDATLIQTGTSIRPVMPEPTPPTKGGPAPAAKV